MYISMKEKFKRKLIIRDVNLNSTDVIDFRNRNIVHPTFLEFCDILSIISSDILVVKLLWLLSHMYHLLSIAQYNNM